MSSIFTLENTWLRNLTAIALALATISGVYYFSDTVVMALALGIAALIATNAVWNYLAAMKADGKLRWYHYLFAFTVIPGAALLVSTISAIAHIFGWIAIALLLIIGFIVLSCIGAIVIFVVVVKGSKAPA